jgi:hypothetical protein
MNDKVLTDKDAYVALKEEEFETRYRYENLRHQQKNGYSLTPDEKVFMRDIRRKGRWLLNKRATDGYNRLFE